MNARSTLLGLFLGLGMLMLASAAPGTAAAQCCTPTPPVCCDPPPPPPPPPPAPPGDPGCCRPGDPSVNVHVSNVNVAIAGARAGASASASAGAGAAAYYYGGGWGGGYTPPVNGASVRLSVDGAARMRRIPYEASRMRTRMVVIQAVCIDSRQVPHPASQVRPDREISTEFEGELYRCLSGTWLQATIADYSGKVDFSGGKTMACAKGQALYHGRNGKLECRRQTPQRDCNERSLLRRFGAGIKILTITEIEKYTAYREEAEQVVEGGMISFDGGVGGYVY